MLRMNFKSADPTPRVPTYLQAHTKENIVWQLKLSAPLLVFLLGRSWYDEYKWQKEMKKYRKNN